ncbi:MAG TPA: DUF6036 family nucleotidyltransferase [Ktedonobacterales bacterium]
MKYLELLGQELERQQLTGEIVIAGGAFMLLAIQNRETTKDIDAYFATEPQAIREAAKIIAAREGLPEDWLNDGVKGFFYQLPPTQPWAEYPGLRVYTVSPEYAFAMKAIAGRPEDVSDLRALIEHLHLSSADAALEIVERYVPQRILTPRTQYLIETLFEDEE